MSKDLTAELHQTAERMLPELDLLIGWTTGYDELHTTPVFISDPRDIAKLVWNPLCTQNLTGYLVKSPAPGPADTAKKIGICVKGCDSRSLVALMQEKFIERDQLYVIGMPCQGVVDWRKLTPQLNGQKVGTVQVNGDHVEVETDAGVQQFAPDQVLARKCLRCRYPNPVIQDISIGTEVVPRTDGDGAYADVAAVERLPLAQRATFWQRELDRCMRCYACRNACPLCVCQDRCIAETRDPKWLPQYQNLSEKYLFHFIHAMHLAGRCTECGECERVCPMGIPVTLIKEKLNQITQELLDFEAGLDPDAVPPLLTFNPSETGI